MVENDLSKPAKVNSFTSFNWDDMSRQLLAALPQTLPYPAAEGMRAGMMAGGTIEAGRLKLLDGRIELVAHGQQVLCGLVQHAVRAQHLRSTAAPLPIVAHAAAPLEQLLSALPLSPP